MSDNKPLSVRVADVLWAVFSVTAMLFVMVFGRWMGDE